MPWRWILAAAVLWIAAGSTAVAGRLPHLPALDRQAITVSGFSSGAFFAHQFHLAYSELVAGAGLVAGGPYGCAEPPDDPWWIGIHPYARVITAVSVCTRIARDAVEAWTDWWSELPQTPDVERSIAVIDVARAEAAIDDPGNVADDRVWLFSGSRDRMVPRATVETLAALYRRMGVTGDRLAVVDDVPAAHGMPVAGFDGASRFPKRGCGDEGPPFVVDCGVDAAGEILRHLYPDGVAAAGEPQRERLREFDQREFFDPGDGSVGLATVGYVYVPQACADKDAACRLHVALHGCGQNAETVDDDFVWDGGYNRWAEGNRIVVLYPQTTAWTPAWDPLGLSGNLQGCWDWWGYGGAGYADRRSAQMRAVRAMVGRLLGE